MGLGKRATKLINDAFAEADVEFLEFFAVAAAISIEKAVVHRELLEKQRIEQQLRLAKQVQSALLPAADPIVPGYDIAGTNVPTWEIGGDYFDYLPQPDGRLGIAVADVSGKGVPAALIMATFRAALRAQHVRGVSLDGIAARLNRILLDSMDASRFVTAFYGLLDPASGAMGFANCGHNPPLLLRAGGSREVVPSGAPALGMWREAAFAPGETVLHGGDLLVLYTDGVVEVMNPSGEMFGLDRLIIAVGVNGVGKTTTSGKLAGRFMAEGKTVLLAAADTFRAAAIEQLELWSQRTGAQIVRHQSGSDPAAVAFDAIEAGKARNIDLVIIDTAGRLHTKSPLMEELKKVRRVIEKTLPGAPHETLLVIDATTGQNALTQAEIFRNATGVTGIALTKLDGTAKGRIVFAIRKELGIPIRLPKIRQRQRSPRVLSSSYGSTCAT